MQTRTAPWDYSKRILIVPQLVRVCDYCGGNAYPRPSDNVRACIDCGGTNIIEKYEHELAEWREQKQAAYTLTIVVANSNLVVDEQVQS